MRKDFFFPPSPKILRSQGCDRLWDRAAPGNQGQGQRHTHLGGVTERGPYSCEISIKMPLYRGNYQKGKALCQPRENKSGASIAQAVIHSPSRELGRDQPWQVTFIQEQRATTSGVQSPGSDKSSCCHLKDIKPKAAHYTLLFCA